MIGDTIFSVKIHKDSSVLESRIENAIQNYNPIFRSDYFKSQILQVLWEVKIILEANGLSRRNWHHGRSEMDRGFIQ